MNCHFGRWLIACVGSLVVAASAGSTARAQRCPWAMNFQMQQAQQPFNQQNLMQQMRQQMQQQRQMQMQYMQMQRQWQANQFRTTGLQFQRPPARSTVNFPGLLVRAPSLGWNQQFSMPRLPRVAFTWPRQFPGQQFNDGLAMSRRNFQFPSIAFTRQNPWTFTNRMSAKLPNVRWPALNFGFNAPGRNLHPPAVNRNPLLAQNQVRADLQKAWQARRPPQDLFAIRNIGGPKAGNQPLVKMNFTCVQCHLQMQRQNNPIARGPAMPNPLPRPMSIGPNPLVRPNLPVQIPLVMARLPFNLPIAIPQPAIFRPMQPWLVPQPQLAMGLPGPKPDLPRMLPREPRKMPKDNPRLDLLVPVLKDAPPARTGRKPLAVAESSRTDVEMLDLMSPLDNPSRTDAHSVPPIAPREPAASANDLDLSQPRERDLFAALDGYPLGDDDFTMPWLPPLPSSILLIHPVPNGEERGGAPPAPSSRPYPLAISPDADLSHPELPALPEQVLLPT